MVWYAPQCFGGGEHTDLLLPHIPVRWCAVRFGGLRHALRECGRMVRYAPRHLGCWGGYLVARRPLKVRFPCSQ